MKLRNTLSAIALTASSLAIISCGEKTTSEAGPEYGLVAKFTPAQLINHLVDNVVVTNQQSFVSALEQQTAPINDYCAAIEQNSLIDEKRLAAQQAYTKTFSAWQLIEQIQLAPLAKDDFALRNKIYAWPSNSACGVDGEVATHNSGTLNGFPYSISNRPNDRKGLFAQEYLLFNQSTDLTCATETGVLIGWSDLPEQTKLARQCAFLQATQTDLLSKVQNWQNTWQQGENAYISELKNGDEQSAINVLGQALFYLDYQLKDSKLGCPLASGPGDCPSSNHANLVEARYAKLNKQAIEQNLKAFYQLFTGATDTLAGDHEDALGFDDYLDAVGDKDTSDKILQAITDAQATLATITTDLGAAISTNNQDYARYQTLQAQIKIATDLLKSDFSISLAVDLPDTSAGDND
ncbi:imelysin family protein [Catenovulum agarivorans]|uniref:imelysin family protein n=1 Tax=Catenovulum agarivorans TaxID=1172192 RepID=UPI00036E4077|nr:imelysin family protein [Catenovulum agarivorans]